MKSLKFFNIKNKGFTLIELLIVIGIIAVLSSVVLMSLNNSRNKSKIAFIQSQAKQLQTEIIRNDINGVSLGAAADWPGGVICPTTITDAAGTILANPKIWDMYAKIVAQTQGASPVYCYFNSTTGLWWNPPVSWVIAIRYPDSSKLFCIDSYNTAKEISTPGPYLWWTYAVYLPNPASGSNQARCNQN